MPIIGVGNQTGNLGKTTLVEGAIVECLRNGLSIGACDLDIEHQTLSTQFKGRVELGIEPVIEIDQPKNAVEAVKLAKTSEADIYWIDCPSRATEATEHIALNVDLFILPTPTSKKDLNLTIDTYYQLVQKGVPHAKILGVLTRVPTEGRFKAAKRYLNDGQIDGKSMNVLASPLWEKTGYELAINDGFSMVETAYERLNSSARAVVHEILTHCLRNG